MIETVAFIHHALEGHYAPHEIKSLTRILLEQVCGISPHQQILHKDNELSVTEKEQIHRFVKRLQTGEPIQYLLGRAEFLGLSLRVNPAVLIPRPETEELVDRILRTEKGKALRILDIGTGSGCIAIALAKFLPESRVTALDLSPEALDIARSNATEQQVTIRFIQADILRTKETEALLSQPFDLIISNPPYVLESEKAMMEPNVLDYEPATALFVPDNDPLLFYRSIAETGLSLLRPGGSLYFEINARCGAITLDMLRRKSYSSIELSQDLSGKDRFIKAIR
ncbi:peptide chain release factor N(5)-glutamine methyltransferase [Parabacteroides sp. Marseille-P3160]|uniref:peptide chain release factor N(5)-glutamine methyltransferase n=1 Tax=Parabacteroides sp. Marseille-P3160 TaxID=1917887 RepID=UPI0009BA93EA|nr:peptide chain release factor N(5)-glutamine methyltransferase [Parabacteroides sp. Marseille-P3160]